MTTSSQQNPDPRGPGRPDGTTPEPARSTRDSSDPTTSGPRSGVDLGTETTTANPTPTPTPTPTDRRETDRAVFATVASPYYGYLIALFVGVMLISNVTGTKGVLLFPDLSFELGFLSLDGLVTDGAFLLFPLAYVLGDVISEVYGFKAMRRVVLSGFAVLALAALSFTFTVHLPPAPFYENQDAFEAVAGVIPQFFLAGLAGYVVGELLNSYVLVWMKRRTGEKTLWARLLGSTVVGQLADTIVFCTIAAPALGMVLGSGDYWNYVVIGFVWKTLVEAVLLPVTYVVIAWIKKREPSYQTALSGSTDAGSPLADSRA
ncbi:queuosine precursor transporter [Dietzia cercidiphylli]|uniref:queuosine precursor transporter n=1 Tax=Dietzia cercidiphylli TaxID=498199 RepID=UPI00223C237C|nr:queuosine precursor transporter [Dietzia cercidiphylli]MCT1516235.1 queuosine precursor transporter [Dietzia cercidiphylli]